MAKKKAKKTAVKKTAKKQVKKAEPKTTVEVTIKRKVLGEAPEEHHFVLEEGKKLKNLYELIDELETMTEETFKKHVNEFKNDFATWIKDIFEANDLSDELRSIQDRMETQKAIMKHIIRDLREMAPMHKLKKAVKARLE